MTRINDEQVDTCVRCGCRIAEQDSAYVVKFFNPNEPAESVAQDNRLPLHRNTNICFIELARAGRLFVRWRNR